MTVTVNQRRAGAALFGFDSSRHDSGDERPTLTLDPRDKRRIGHDGKTVSLKAAVILAKRYPIHAELRVKGMLAANA